MPFPEKQRIIYKKNPIDRVVCQLRFPPILKIDKDIPADFQDKIRDVFPNYVEKTEVNVEVDTKDIEILSPDIFSGIPQPAKIKNCEFSSEDDVWKVNLTRTFIALTTSEYIQWEEFYEKLLLPLDTLCEIYKPLYFSRIGLRYIDVIDRSKMGIEGVPWDELLKPHILGILSSKSVKENVRDFVSKYEINLADNISIVRMVTKFVKPRNPRDSKNDEICYMIDSDFHSLGKLDKISAIEKLEYFHIRGSRLIQWCITDRLHEAMEPKKI